jgi:hypothetical protein
MITAKLNNQTIQTIARPLGAPSELSRLERAGRRAFLKGNWQWKFEKPISSESHQVLFSETTTKQYRTAGKCFGPAMG